MPSVLMSSILNLYPKKFNPDFIFIGLFLLRIPQSIQDHLLALDLDENPDVLARKAHQLFQSHPASSLTFLPAILHLQFLPSIQPNLDPAKTATHLHPILQSLAVPAPQLPLTAIRGLHPPSPPPAGSTGHTETRLRSVSNPAPGHKTNRPVGRKHFSPCWFLLLSSEL